MVSFVFVLLTRTSGRIRILIFTSSSTELFYRIDDSRYN
uniref:Uncharacterized protein n=1 Tax=Anguilla anguilla TaxID=7936 RepID=A0A0E9T0K5_ANGAN